MNPSRRRLLAEQIVAVVVLGCGKKVDAMWHVPHINKMVENSKKNIRCEILLKVR